jgi:hypothetical protein
MSIDSKHSSISSTASLRMSLSQESQVNLLKLLEQSTVDIDEASLLSQVSGLD